MAIHRFRIGDLLQPKDGLSLYVANLAMAFNDLVFTNVKMDEATDSWERFYWSRLAFAHFNEVMLYVEGAQEDGDIGAFIGRLPEEAQERYAGALRRYNENRGVLNRLRSETAFHYPTGKSVKAISKAIEQAQEHRGAAGSVSSKIKDARMFFADDLLARMVFNAAGGGEEEYASLVGELARAVRDFMKFTNAALDQLFVERVGPS